MRPHFGTVPPPCYVTVGRSGERAKKTSWSARASSRSFFVVNAPCVTTSRNSMDTYLMRIFFAVSAVLSVVSSQTCERAHFERCMEQLLQFTGKDDLIFADSETELREQCLLAQSALSCVSRYIKKCIALEERKEYSDNVSGLQKLTEALCTENSDLRPRYLSSLPCFRNVSEGVHFCQDKFRRNQNDILQVSYSDKTPLFCCSFDGYRRCLRMLLTLQEECAEEPVAVMDEIVHKMAGGLGEGVCDPYFEKCTGAGAPPALFSSLLTALACLLAYALLRKPC